LRHKWKYFYLLINIGENNIKNLFFGLKTEMIFCFYYFIWHKKKLNSFVTKDLSIGKTDWEFGRTFTLSRLSLSLHSYVCSNRYYIRVNRKIYNFSFDFGLQMSCALTAEPHNIQYIPYLQWLMSMHSQHLPTIDNICKINVY